MGSLAERLAEALEDEGLTLVALSDATGFSQSNLSRIARGKVDPSVRTVVKLAEALGVTVDWLVGLDAPRTSLTHRDAVVLNLFRGLPEDRKKVIIDLMNW